MKINKNDPRLTAYVLGELNSADSALIEAALKNDSELQKEVLLIRKSTQLLGGLSSTESHRLSPEQRSAIFPPAKSSRAWWTLSGGLVTAALALVIFQRSHYEATKITPDKISEVSEVAKVPEPPKILAKEPPAAVAADTVADAAADVAAETQAEAAAPAESALAEYSRSEALGSASTSSAGAYADSEPAKRKMLTAMSAGGRASFESSRSIAFSQILPKETDTDLAAFIDSSVKPIVQNCLAENLSKYVKYHLMLTLKFKLQSGSATGVNITDPADTQVLTAELQACLARALQQPVWPAVSNDFEYRLSIDSK